MASINARAIGQTASGQDRYVRVGDRVVAVRLPLLIQMTTVKTRVCWVMHKGCDNGANTRVLDEAQETKKNPSCLHGSVKHP